MAPRKERDFVLTRSVARLETTRLRHGSSVVAVASCGDKRTIVSVSKDGTVSSWDITTGKELKRLTIGWFSVVAISPHKKSVAVVSADKGIVCWDLSTSKGIRRLPETSLGISTLSFSPDGTLLAVGRLDGTMAVWDLTSEKKVAQCKVGPWNLISTMVFSADGKRIASCAQQDNADTPAICLWTLSSNRLKVWYWNKPARAVAFCHDGKYIATGSKFC